VPKALDLLPRRSRRADVPRERVLEEFQHTLELVVHPESLHTSVIRGLQELFDFESLALLLLDADLNLFQPVASRGFLQESVSGLRFSPSDHLIAWLRVNETSLEIKPDSGIFHFLSPPEQETLLRLGVKFCVPLVSMNRIIGLLLLGPTRRREFTERDRTLLSALTSQAALALENALLYRQQTDRLRRMYRAERLATAGQLASGVAHEIRNPLTAIRSTMQLLARDFQGDPARRELLEGVLGEVDRINQIIAQLLSFARPSEFRLEPVQLNAVIEFSLSLMAPQARLHNVRIVHNLAALPNIPGDEAQLKQLFLNLLMNSLQAMPEGGELRIESAPLEAEPVPSAVRVSITDTGCGIPDEVMDCIFDPFFTTKPEGTGLGLSVSYAIVERHRGEISLRSTPGKGTTVFLKFPCRVHKSETRLLTSDS